MDKTLSELIPVRFFKGDRKKMKTYLKAFPGRFDNQSHFIRCAVINLERELDKEILNAERARAVNKTSTGRKVAASGETAQTARAPAISKVRR